MWNRTSLVVPVLLAGLVGVVRADPAPDAAVKTAIEKSLKRIETGIINYPKHRQCFSCHHQAMAVMSMTSAKERGFAVDSELLKKQIDFSLRSFRNKTQIAKGQGVGGDSVSVAYALHMFAAVERPYDDTMATLVQYLLVKQRKDGAWPIPALGDRPPTMGSLFTNTGLVMFALKKYSPPKESPGAADVQSRIDAALAKGRTWLLANKPVANEDRVFHLHGLVYSGVPAKEIDAARELLVKEQRSDGSWAQLAKMSGDVYATGTALVALRQAGLDLTHEAYQKGVKYLLDAQRDDGFWIVQTRSRPLQVFFDNGDPGGKSQFISFAATNWAVLALLETVPTLAQKEEQKKKEDQTKKSAAQPTAARIQKRTYDFKEASKKEMEYALFVHSKYDKAKKSPLIVALHGLGSTPQQIMRYRGLTDLAEQHGYIVVAPMGYNSSGWYGVKGPTGKGEPKNLGELSEKDVMNVLALVRKEFNVDEMRIYLMGHSMGGGGTWHLGLKHPDLWAGLAPIAPAIFKKPDDLEKIKHIPVIVVQGDQDKLVPVAGARRWVERMKELKMTHEYLEIAGGGHVDIAFTGMPKIFEFFNKHKKSEKK